MSEREFEAYLNLLARTLKLSEAQRARIAGELRDHLEARMEELTDAGLDREAAILQALDEFGDANVLAKDLTEPQRRLRRRRLMQTSFATLATAAVIATGFFYLLPAQTRTGQPMLPTTQAQPAPEAAAESAPLGPAAARPLDQVVTVHYQDDVLEAVFDHLGAALGVNVFVYWGALEEVGITRDYPVTMNLIDVRAETVLGLLAESLTATAVEGGVGYEVRDNVVVIGDRRQLRGHDLAIEIYDCTRIVEYVDHLRPARGFRGYGDNAQDTRTTDEHVGSFLYDALGEEAWGEGTSVSALAGMVLVRQTEERHAQLHEVLNEIEDRLAQRVEQVKRAHATEALLGESGKQRSAAMAALETQQLRLEHELNQLEGRDPAGKSEALMAQLAEVRAQLTVLRESPTPDRTGRGREGYDGRQRAAGSAGGYGGGYGGGGGGEFGGGYGGAYGGGGYGAAADE